MLEETTPMLAQGSFRTVNKLWSPKYLRKTVLYGCCAASLALLCIIAALHILDSRRGAVFISTGLEFSPLEQFTTQYLPIILVVAFGLLISIVDLEIRRLEPWFQLSDTRTGGATKALYCRYDTEFILNVVFRAARSGHWPVFAAALCVVLTSVVIPPLSNSLFTNQTVNLRQPLPPTRKQQIVSQENQLKALTTNFLNDAYSIAWLDQSQPAFTTSDYALQPFGLSGEAPGAMNATVTSTSTKYWTELNCWLPESISTNATNYTLFATNVKDDTIGSIQCTLPYKADGRTNNQTLWNAVHLSSEDTIIVGATEQDDHVELDTGPSSIRGACPGQDGLSLFIWMDAADAGTGALDFKAGGNAAASFCKARYFQQSVTATVDAVNGTLIHVTDLGKRSELELSEYNHTNFESILANGDSFYFDTAGNTTGLHLDIADGLKIIQSRRLSEAGIDGDTPVIGFAYAMAGQQPDKFLDLTIRHAALQKAYQLALAMSMTYVFEPGPDINSEIVLSKTRNAVKMLSVFAFPTEGLLVATLLLCLLLAVLVPQRVLKLVQDPESLSQVAILARMPAIQDHCAANLASSDTVVGTTATDTNVSLDIATDGRPALIDSAKSKPHCASTISSPSRQLHSSTPKNIAKANELSSFALTAVIVATSITFIALLVLKLVEQRQRGLRPLKVSPLAQQVVLKYIPTALATLLSGYLTLVCRTYSFIKPFEVLKRGNASSRNTIGIVYSSSLPTLLWFRSFAARHYVLALLSLVALLSHTILTVTMASLFSARLVPSVSTLVINQQYLPSYSPTFTPSKFSQGRSSDDNGNIDSIYTSIANITRGTALPRWTTDQYAFLPLPLTAGSSPGSSVSHIEVETVGFGVQTDCVDPLAPTSNVATELSFLQYSTGWMSRFVANYTQPDGTVYRCWFIPKIMWDDFGHGIVFGSITEKTVAVEFSNIFQAINTTGSIQESDFCTNQTVKAWIRAHVSETTSSNGTVSQFVDYNATTISCSAKLKMQNHRLTVSSTGDVLAATAIGEATTSIPSSIKLNQTLDIVRQAMYSNYFEPAWHSDTVTRDWPNYLFKKMLNSSDLVDSTLAPPSFDRVKDLMTRAYSRLFAVQFSFNTNKLLLANGTQPLGSRAISGPADGLDVPLQVTINTYTTSQRIFMSMPNLLISLVVLLLDVLVLSAFALRLQKPFLPQLPYTIASQIAYLSGSHVIQDVLESHGDCRVLDRKGFKYSYGRYVGSDGHERIGIERAEFIIGGNRPSPASRMNSRNTPVPWPSWLTFRKPVSQEQYPFRPIHKPSPSKDTASVNVSEREGWI